MKLFRCDRCEKTESPKEGADYVEDWESVIVSTNFHYDICGGCSRELFDFFKAAK